jgi:hypothetical protein
MSDFSNDCCLSPERFCFWSFLVSFGILLLWFLSIVFASDLVIDIHANFFGIKKANLEQFAYDWKMIHYILMGSFKLAVTLLFFIPWVVLRFLRSPKASA